MKTKSYYILVIFSLVFLDFFLIFRIIVIKDFFEKEINFYQDEKRKQYDSFIRDLELNSQTIEIDKDCITGYFGNADPCFGDIDPSCSKWFKEQIA